MLPGMPRQSTKASAPQPDASDHTGEENVSSAEVQFVLLELPEEVVYTSYLRVTFR